MLDALFMMGSLGLIVGICLAVASKVFYVYVDPKIEAVEDAKIKPSQKSDISRL